MTKGKSLLQGLTDRQRAPLETAYTGNFDWPGTSSGKEVAERKLFGGIFKDA